MGSTTQNPVQYKNEYKFIKETIDSRAIFSPKLLVNDH